MTIQLVIDGETVTVIFGEKVATATLPDRVVQRFRRIPHESHTNFLGRVVRYLTGRENQE